MFNKIMKNIFNHAHNFKYISFDSALALFNQDTN